MSDVGKGMLIVLVILYIVSPIDFAPGPVDDAIVLLLGMAAVTNRKKMPQRRRQKLSRVKMFPQRKS